MSEDRGQKTADRRQRIEGEKMRRWEDEDRKMNAEVGMI
jgi:hypothetical protein